MASIEDFEFPRSTPNEDAKSDRLLDRLAEFDENSGARITLLLNSFGMLNAITIPITTPAVANLSK